MAESNIHINPSNAVGGINLSSIPPQAGQGKLSYAINAVVENLDGKSLSYQNELGSVITISIPDGYTVNGRYVIPEREIIMLWLVGEAGDEIRIIEKGIVRSVKSDCLNLSTSRPIHKAFHRTLNCGTEVYWTDGGARKYLNIDKFPYMETPDPNGCATIVSTEIDCNKLLVQPNFSIPTIEVTAVENAGEIPAGTVQFAAQYANKNGQGYTSYYSVTNPLPIHDSTKVLLDFNYTVNKSVLLSISGIETSGVYDHLNIAVIKNVNGTSSFELVGTYFIDKSTKEILYTGQKIEKLTEGDIFERFPVISTAQDVYTTDGVLGWADLTLQERISYQEIASQIDLQWQSWRLKKDAYAESLHAANHRGYMRDEIYPLEFVPLLKNGYMADGFSIPGRQSIPSDLEMVNNKDVITTTQDECTTGDIAQPRWKVYNTATLIGNSPEYIDDPCYEGPYQYGDMAYWESMETYSCEESLAGRPIRHHKLPDCLVSPIHDGEYIYPMGIKIDIGQVLDAIRNSSLTQEQKDNIQGFKIVRGNRAGHQKSVIAKGLINNVMTYKDEEGVNFYTPNHLYNDVTGIDPYLSDTEFTNDSKSRVTFHSPDTSFFKPNLGNILKLETIEEGISSGHTVQVKEHSKYKIFTDSLYLTALAAAGALAIGGTGLDGLSTESAIAAYQVLTDIFERVTPRINYAYQYNSIGNYTNTKTVLNSGFKQRTLEIGRYLIPGNESFGDTYSVNNYQRESSVYLKIADYLPYTHEQGSVVDNSKILTATGTPVSSDISSYYAAIKKSFPNQWGQLYSYETIDTGFQWVGDITSNTATTQTIFGGDVFINRFAYKRKFPLFLDNGVGRQDDSDIFFDELFNVGKANYWYSANIKGQGATSRGFNVGGFLFGTKEHHLYQDSGKHFFYRIGKIFLFTYAIPYFFCESEVNVDMRQAFNGQEGDFYPHVGSGIPDEWLQEINTTIKQDNTYHYNKSYSKQNKESYFSHIPESWDDSCEQKKPFDTIYSDQNNWLIYRPLARYTFPQDYGKLVSVTGLDGGATLVQYENKSQIYNTQLTLSASNGQVAYLGNDTLFKSGKPLDFSHIGSQHKFFVSTPYGDVIIDARRGKVWLLQGTKPKEITTDDVGKFFEQYFYTEYDNHFQNKGITGVYDPANKRVLITKLDGKKSFTLSYNFLTQSWISFHSYLPLYYVNHPTSFYAANSVGIWLHGKDITLYNNFFGEIAPYTIEYPQAFKFRDELLQSIKDYTQALIYQEDGSYVQTSDYFNKAILSTPLQSSGELNLFLKPKNSLKQQALFPKYNATSKDIIYTQSDSFYNFNTFWALNDNTKPIWLPSQINLSIYKELNQPAMDYSKRSFKKAPLRAKDLKIRLTLDNRSDLKLISTFITTQTQISYK